MADLSWISEKNKIKFLFKNIFSVISLEEIQVDPQS